MPVVLAGIRKCVFRMFRAHEPDRLCMLPSTLLIVVSCFSAPPTLDEALTRYAASESWLDSASMHVFVDGKDTGPAFANSDARRVYEFDFWRHGDRFEISGLGRVLRIVDNSEVIEGRLTVYHALDDVLYTGVGRGDRVIQREPTTEHLYPILFSPYFGLPIEGYIAGNDHIHIRDLLRFSAESADAQIVDLNGTMCFEYSADTRYGAVSVTLDPAANWLARRWRVVKSSDNYFDGVLLADTRNGQSLREWSAELHSVQVANIQGTSIPARATLTLTYSNWDGTNNVMSFIIERSAVRLEIGESRFHMTDGVEVRRESDTSGMTWVWQNGDVVRYVDAQKAASIAQSAQAFNRGVPFNPTNDSKNMRRDAYCGMNALYAAACILNIPLAYDALIDPRYIGSKAGSSAAEIIQAATDNGLSVLPLSNVRLDFLCRSIWPVILFVKRDQDSPSYNHWITITQTDNGALVAIDDDAGHRHMSAVDVAMIWSGHALIVAPGNVELTASSMLFRDWLRTGIVLLLAFMGTVIGRRRFHTQRSASGGFFHQFVGMFLLVGIGTIVAVSLSPALIFGSIFSG